MEFSVIITASRSQLTLISWLRNHLLPCPFKYLTGIDCPGCGFQRSVLALVQGSIGESFMLYPAAIPLLALFTYGIADRFVKLDNNKGTVKKTLFMLVGGMVMLTYCFKICRLYLHYIPSVAVAATM